MSKVTVTTTANHFSNNIMYKVGDTYETNKQNAELLKGSGLVDFDDEGKTAGGTPLFRHRDTTSEITTTAIAGTAENSDGNMPAVSKGKLEQEKSKDKAHSEKKAKKEKIEGKFPGSKDTKAQ